MQDFGRRRCEKCWYTHNIVLHGPDDRELPPELLVDHEPEDAHHRGAALVQLDGALGELGLLVEGIPPEVEGAVAEIPGEIPRRGAVGGVLHDPELERPDEEDDLREARPGDGVRPVDRGPPVGEGVEGMPGVIDVPREVDAGAGDDVPEERELGDASVLDLDVPEAVEPLLVGVVEEAEGIEEAEGGLGAELGFEGAEGRGGLGDGGRGEGGGGTDDGGDDDGLHVSVG